MLNLDDVNALFPLAPAPEQARAVELAAEHNVVVITGGPGVGKTFTTKAIVQLFHQNNLSVSLCAPTGKAAVRMSEATGDPASTIHRLLQWTPKGFTHCQDEPLPSDVVILDEASMVDVELFDALVSALKPGARFVIVGDVDQLPSIGAGRVLYDLIESGTVPTVRLTKIFRQASESAIPYVARDINKGGEPDFVQLASDTSDVRFVGSDDVAPQSIANAVVEAFRTRLPNKGFTQDDIQVLCAQKKEACGVEALNNTLQHELNPNAAYGDGLKVGNGYKVFESDRVIHTRNNYSLATFNGEIGKVVAVSWRGLKQLPEGAMVSKSDGPIEWTVSDSRKFVVVVRFDDRTVGYTQPEAYDLELAYAITVHKSQGSQFRAVIMPVHSCHSFMLTRPLVYTGITRAAEYLLMIGEPSVLGKAGTNTRGVARRTTLFSEA